jgi:hypothetical protein
MAQIVLSSPLFHVYLIWLGALLLAAFWSGQGTSSRRAAPRPRGGEQSRDRLQTTLSHWPTLPGSRLPGTGASRDRLPVRELRAACSAEYEARFSQAIKQIPGW